MSGDCCQSRYLFRRDSGLGYGFFDVQKRGPMLQSTSVLSMARIVHLSAFSDKRSEQANVQIFAAQATKLALADGSFE
jgi:hypothetical protein